jgi:ABC-type polysaccharide/polyol phosphate transport system ATPase subunit
MGEAIMSVTAASTEGSQTGSVFDRVDVMVDVRNVCVAYRAYKERPTSLKETIVKALRTGSWVSYSTFDALHDVSFQVKRGMILGVIGGNGSGKSTLLKILAQVLKPSSGTVQMNGTIASLMDLGVGFDMDLNAIENIYLNGSLYRKTREEIEARVQPILDFAELHEFAVTPIKYYSAGMIARLGFATAVDIDPDILLVDEVLGVGDERFQEKCKGVFERFIKSGKTIILVSHSLDYVKSNAHRALLLSRGRVAYFGDPSEAVALYRDSSYQTRLGAALE